MPKQSDLDNHAELIRRQNMPKQSDLDNHADQLNPKHDEYWHSRGLKRPDNEDDYEDDYDCDDYEDDIII